MLRRRAGLVNMPSDGIDFSLNVLAARIHRVPLLLLRQHSRFGEVDAGIGSATKKRQLEQLRQRW